MKAEVLPSNLKTALKIVKPAMARHSALPVLKNVLVAVGESGAERIVYLVPFPKGAGRKGIQV